ncbi:MAG: hypothetical protein LBH67_02185 [Rickettsia sp.]|nr:hypothetical protein [Rickettsia sp.]
MQSFKKIRVDDFFCNFLDKRFCFFFLKLEQIFIFQRFLDCFVAAKLLLATYLLDEEEQELCRKMGLAGGIWDKKLNFLY